MGGYAGGATAAQLTVDAVRSILDELQVNAGWRARQGRRSGQNKLGRWEKSPRRLVSEAVRTANADVRSARKENPEFSQMGATLTVALASDDGGWLVANVGDSPAWVVSRTSTERVTEDHNVAFQMLRKGAITLQQSLTHPGRHVLLRGIGIDMRAVPSVSEAALGSGDRLVLASDGLEGGVETSKLHELLPATTEGSAQADAQLLVDLAVEGGTSDNVTVVVVRHDGPSEDAVEPSAAASADGGATDG